MVKFFQLLIPGAEIIIIAVVIYSLLSFFWNTRGMDLILGIIAFGLMYGAASLLHLPVLQRLMWYFVNVAVIAVLIIFQPELRLALARLSVKGKKYKEINELDKFLDAFSASVYRMAERGVGALIVLENQDSLDEYANKAVRLGAEFTPELLETIFSVNTPLHDGGVIIRGTTILSAATILPLADESAQITRSMGTRHRAALGMSQVSDALVIVVSEEKRTVSVARSGIMTKGIKPDRFKGIIRSVFTVQKSSVESSFEFLEQLKKWNRHR